MTVHLVQAPIDMRAFFRWAVERGWSRRGTFDEGLALHHLTVEMFGTGAVRPFRLLVPPRGRGGNLYGYSASRADTLRAQADVQAMPDQIAVIDPSRLLTKPMPGSFRAGQRIGFDVRVRPVRRIKTALGDSFGPGDEVDAYLHEALRDHAGDRAGMDAQGRTREAVYLDWLADRLAPAAELDKQASRLHGFRRTRVVRNRTARDGPDAIVHGTLTVTDPDAFAGMLGHGVGRHCAYGYGMLLLRAPQSPVPER